MVLGGLFKNGCLVPYLSIIELCSENRPSCWKIFSFLLIVLSWVYDFEQFAAFWPFLFFCAASGLLLSDNAFSFSLKDWLELSRSASLFWRYLFLENEVLISGRSTGWALRVASSSLLPYYWFLRCSAFITTRFLWLDWLRILLKSDFMFRFLLDYSCFCSASEALLVSIVELGFVGLAFVICCRFLLVFFTVSPFECGLSYLAYVSLSFWNGSK